MMDWMMTHCLRNCQVLSETVTDMTWQQWRFLVAQSRFGISLWNVLLGVPPASPSSSQDRKGVAGELPGPPETAPEAVEAETASAPGNLETLATERLRKGLAPPREIYDVQNRGRIDWSSVPYWARPVDPEMFEGGHEG